MARTPSTVVAGPDSARSSRCAVISARPARRSGRSTAPTRSRALGAVVWSDVGVMRPMVPGARRRAHRAGRPARCGSVRTGVRPAPPRRAAGRDTRCALSRLRRRYGVTRDRPRARDRRRRADQALRRGHGRRRPVLRGPRGRGHGLPRAQRRGQDDHAADGARPRPADGRSRDDPRAAVPGAARARPLGRRQPRDLRHAPGPLGAQPPARARRVRGAAGVAGRRGARPRRDARRRRPARRRVLDRHAPAARARRHAARRPARCSCSTSPPTASTRRASAGCATSCAPRPPRAAPSSSPATCSPRSSRPSTTSSSSTAGGWCSRARSASLTAARGVRVRSPRAAELAAALERATAPT